MALPEFLWVASELASDSSFECRQLFQRQGISPKAPEVSPKFMVDHDRLFKELISTFFVEFIELFLPQILEYLEADSITLFSACDCS